MDKATKLKRDTTIVVKLKYPFEFGEDEIKEISLRRPKGKWIKNLGTNPRLSDLLEIASKCSAHPPSVFDEMDAGDALMVAEKISDFLDSGRGTGKDA